LDAQRGTTVDENDGVAFTVTRNDGDDVCLQLGDSVGICDDMGDDDWAKQLDDHAVAPIGTIPPRDRTRTERVPLFVLTAPAAARVDVTYRTGPATTHDVGRDGAVVIVDSGRGPREVIARDAAGAQLGRADISDQQWSWCRDPDGCEGRG
jgi:hypothetical protein